MGSKREVSAKKAYLAMVQDFSLEEHDKKYHGGHFDPKTMSCGKRDELAKGDDPRLDGGTEVSAAKSQAKSGGDALARVSDLAKAFSDLREEGRKAPMFRKDPRYQDIEPVSPGAYQRKCDRSLRDDTMKAQEAFFKALKDLPWSAFGDDDGDRDKKLADFDAKLPNDANLDALFQDEADGVDDGGADHWDPAEVFEMFCDARGKDDKTLGDTMRNAKPVIERTLNERGKDDLYEKARAEEDWQNYQAERDAFRYNAPFTAWAEGW